MVKNFPAFGYVICEREYAGRPEGVNEETRNVSVNVLSLAPQESWLLLVLFSAF